MEEDSRALEGILDLVEVGIPVSCNLDCGGGCPLLAYVKEGRITRIGNNPLGSPYMSGCVRGFQRHKVLYSPERLKKPLLRTGPRGSGQFEEIEWPEALDLVARRLVDIKERHGNEAILRLGGSGAYRSALHSTSLLTKRFLSLFGGYTETFSNYSRAAASFVTPYVLGTQSTGFDVATLQHSNLIILWGANVSDTRLGCETEARIKEARDRGVSVIVIDPRRSATSRQLGTQWIPVRPGTDTALMMAVLYVLIDEGMVDRDFLEKYSSGFDRLEQHVLGHRDGEAKTPGWAEEICGTPSDLIRRFAVQYGQTHPASLIPGLSIQRTLGGEEAIRMGIILQVATGNLGVLGGSSGAITWSGLPYPKMDSISVPPNPAQASVPVCCWPDAIIEGKNGGYPSDIKAIYNVGGNFLMQGADIHKNIKAFKKVEFAVCHDYFLTPSAQYCDVVLPVTTFLERDDVIFPQGGNYLLFTNQAVLPVHEVRNDYDIFCQLADRFGFLSEYSEGKSDEEWLKSFVADSEVPDYREFRRTGIYMGEDQMRVGLSDFVEDPQAHPLKTPSGLVEIFSEEYARTGASPIPEYRNLAVDERYPLRLITPKSRFRIHSQNDNIPWFKERERQALWINPINAAERGVENGREVCVNSPEGRVRIAALVTEDIMLGVVCLLEGVWPRFDSEGVDTAGSANVLTSTTPTEPSKGSRTHSVCVEVTGTNPSR